MDKRQGLAIIASIALVAIAMTVGLNTNQEQASAQQAPFSNNERIISVTGTATVTVFPDLLNMQFGVDTEAKTAQDAISTNSVTMNQVIEAVKKLGITEDEISTSSFNIYPEYNYTTEPYTGIQHSQLTGYKVSNTLYIKTSKLTLAGNILDAAVAAGANRVDNVSFTLSPAKQQSVQDDLLANAVINAKSRAEKALEPLGQQIIGVKAVQLSEFNEPPPIQLFSEAMAPVSGVNKETPIFTSNQEVTTTASVIFLIGDKQ